MARSNSRRVDARPAGFSVALFALLTGRGPFAAPLVEVSLERFAVPLPVVDFAIVVALFFATAVHVKRALRKSPARGKTCGE